MAPILKGCSYASIYSKALKDVISSRSEGRREVIYDDIFKLYQDWRDGLEIFAERGYYGLFPDSLYNKIVKVDEKMREWIKLRDEVPTSERTWEKDSIISKDMLKISEDLKQEIRRLLNVSAL